MSRGGGEGAASQSRRLPSLAGSSWCEGLCLCFPPPAGGAHCVGKGASLAGHQCVIICSLALIGWMRGPPPRTRDTEVCAATFSSVK